MFTGIVEELGRLRARKGESIVTLTIEASTVLEDLSIGDSIAVNGTCLTAVRIGPESFDLELVPETLRRTNLGALRPGDPVNLERSLTAQTRMGGHFVQGHVDGRGEVRAIEPDGEGRLVRFTAPPEVMRYVVPKGFVAVDGASLTVVDQDEDSFRIAYIPHTLAVTVAGAYAPGSPVNLEADILGKYVERLLAARFEGAAAEGAPREEDLSPWTG